MTAEELARYRAQLDETAARARSYVLRRLSEEGAGLGVAESRDLAIEVVEDATDVFGDQAQEVASELFDEVMEADGAEARATSFDGLIDHGRTEGKVHYYAGRIEAGDRAGFEARSADLAAYYVHRSAWENLVRNCDLAHVMWARVPTGRETCPYCLMLASRGFAYHTRDTASHGKHRGCDCVVVPGNKGASIEGYDPEECGRLWQAFEEIEAMGHPDGTPLSREEAKSLWAETLAGRVPGGEMDAMQKRNADAMRREIARDRQLGPQEGKGVRDYFDVSNCMPEMEDVISEAMDYVPTEWLLDARNAGVKIVGVVDPRGRCSFLPEENAILMDYRADFLQVVHEIVHAREQHRPELLSAERRFFESRIEGREREHLAQLDPLGLYESSEMAYDVIGRSPYAYLYKDYDENGREGYEVGPFGIESMYRYPNGFEIADKTAFEFAKALIRRA